MYSSNTQQSLKSGVSPNLAIKSTHTRKKAPLQDNSWIKKDREEDEPGDENPNYSRDVLSSLETWNSTESKPADAKQSNKANLNTSVSSFTKSESRDFPNKNTTPTATKPPVPDKKTAFTTQSNNFTSRVFSGANSSEKMLNPVKKFMNEKSDPVSDPRKEVPDSTESKIKIPIPPTTTITSVRKTAETFTTPEKTYPSFASKKETDSKSLEQSSPKSPLDTYTSQQVNTTELTVGSTVKLISHASQSLHSPMNPTPVPSTASRIVGKRDLCSFCAKSIIEGERIILDDLQIFSHTFCFKCDICYHALGNLEAGDSLWVHRGRVTCANCYIKTKDQWYR
ncbi:zinc finger protein 185 [Ictalurus punctatus]|uniref:Zinc finger protein 185 n=1 Tax=Ictalurus punctatus TaxID=7998 RepID=A0A2D0S5D1_ICTPU|nr:zinc finger protein 185 [Ictalurus punctatus]